MVFYNKDKQKYFTIQSTLPNSVQRWRLSSLISALMNDKQLQAYTVKTISADKNIYHVTDEGEMQIRAAIKGMAAVSMPYVWYINGAAQ